MASPTDVTNPLPPVEAPNELWLLAEEGWVKLGQASLTEPRWTNALELKGALTVPDGLQNRWCWLAHEGQLYRATYLSHVGVGGATTVCLKIDTTLSPEQFAALPAELVAARYPTADLLRKLRFGGEYHSYRRMFAPGQKRLV